MSVSLHLQHLINHLTQECSVAIKGSFEGEMEVKPAMSIEIQQLKSLSHPATLLMARSELPGGLP
jgi:hypothetical protein